MTKAKRVTAVQVKARRLDPGQMSAYCDPQVFDFSSTKEILPLEEGIIGQARAVKAMEFGLAAKHPDFHIFITGPAGSGKTNYATTKVKQVAMTGQTPADICFVNNFDQSDWPLVLVLPAGMGCELRRDMKELVDDLRTEVRKAFEGETYEKRKALYLKHAEAQLTEIFKEMEELAHKQGFLLQKGTNGIFTVPVNAEGKAMSKEEFDALDDEERQDITDREQKLEAQMAEIMRRTRNLQKDTKQQLKDIERDTALHATGHLIDVLKEKYKDHAKVVDYLSRVQEDVMNNLDDFKGASTPEPEEGLPPSLATLVKIQKAASFTRYEVNVFVENSTRMGSPIVVETNPTYYNLFGKVEYRSSFGSLVTDFTMIKPGAVHQANGGYLILQAMPLLSSPGAWEGLKRMLKSKEVRIENLGEQLGLSTAATLKPEAIPVKVKVILIGNPHIYHLLYSLDEDFRKFFKVRVDFDGVMERNDTNIRKYAAFVSSVCQRENLQPFTSAAVSRVIDFSSRLVSHQQKLSTCFHNIKDIVVESALWATQQGSDVVDLEHVELAIQEKISRSNRIEERIREAIDDGSVLLDTNGSVVGQVNGLAVLNPGDYSFGKPSRITARVYLGREGIVNIERETRMSGQTHTKGVMILSSFFSSRYAQDHPLSLSATLTFEQLYEGVDGDSASSTELYALLSAISGLPIPQGIAVTGSVNQKGEIQPIGGVNEKIEGFFKVCQARGLTGDQGVIIPAQNVQNLMLDKEVIEAAKASMFHIYPVKHVDEGIEILTGVTAGTVNQLVAEKLQLMNEKWKNANERYPKVRRIKQEKGN